MKNKKEKNVKQKLVANPENYMDSFRQNIFLLMTIFGFTIRELSEKADMPFDTLRTFLYGDSKDAKLSTAIKLARVFGISVDELVGAGTINPITIESLQMFRELPEHSQYLLRWLIRHQYHINMESIIHGEKVISVFKPTCNDGNLEMTHISEPYCIDHMPLNIKAKVFVGLQLPCEHYMPAYSPHDILLIASDREARDGEHCVVTYYGKIFIVQKKIRKSDSGNIVEYIGLVDPTLRINESEIDEKVGYVVTTINKQ